MDKKKKHSFKSRRRAFAIWQKLGYFPWHRPEKKKARKRSRDFYRGAFDNIPFLNDDAKRTFSHLLLRPGYMIRDYIKGAHERYLAPLTALIVFYAFFALVAAVMQPVQQRHRKEINPEVLQEDVEDQIPEDEHIVSLFMNTLKTLKKGWIYLHLDQFPEEVDTQHESSLAALEGTLRSQGIPLFAGQFLLLWLAMSLALRRRYRQRMSAYAAASAYILCQFSFFMLFALLFSFGKSAEIGIVLIVVLLMWDYHQRLTPYTEAELAARAAEQEAARKAAEAAAKKNKSKKAAPAPAPFRTYARQLLEAMDWITDQCANAQSEYYHCIDLDKVAAMGQSCGGAQVLAVAHDPRIKTCLIFNSGIGEMSMSGASKESLANLHQPMLYLNGGTADVAYENANGDWKRIKELPVVKISTLDGHHGTYYEKNAGAYAVACRLWLNWQLKGQVGDSALFMNDEYGKMVHPDWTFDRKNW